VTGVISLENLLIIMDHFKALPASTTVIELEPVEQGWGMDMTALGRQKLEEAVAWIQADVQSRSRVSSNGAARTSTP
jgi:hypothetical protein